jgi:hypothetical protein
MAIYAFEKTINLMEKIIVIKSKTPITEYDHLCICVAYKYIFDEYEKLTYIMNEENRVLEAKYNAIESIQNDSETKEDLEWCKDISQYIINLDV